MSHLPQDFRYALRSLRTRPGFSLVVVLTLALGIGVNTAIVSLVNAVLLKPLPFADPDRVMMVWGSCPELAAQVGLPDKLPPSPAAFYDWRAQTHSLEKLAMLRADRANLTGRGEPTVLGVVAVTGDFFAALGTRPLYGRAIEPADDDSGKGKVAVLSHAAWLRRFGGDRAILGRAIQLDGKPVTVVGIMPERFAFPRGAEMPTGYGFAADPDLWLPMAWTPEERHERDNHGAVPIGRLKPGVSLATADAEMKAIAQHLAELYPKSDKGWSVRIEPLSEQMVGEIRPALLVLLGAVGFVLLIACANVANLLLAQAAVRQREIAIRTAIGADRGRLLRQLLTESLVLSLLGGGLGVVFALWALSAFSAWLPVGLPGAAALALDGRVLAATAGLALLTGLVAGLAPALQTTRPDLAESLREGTRGAGAALGRRTRSLLVASEMAIAVLLLIGAGLLIRSFARLSAVDPGFRAENVLTLRISLPETRVKRADRAAFLDRAIEKMQGLPGVREVGAVSTLPLSGEENMDNYFYEGQAPPKPGQLFLADNRSATPGYLRALQIPLRRGRFLTASDTAQAPLVAVVSESIARASWPNADPIGKRIYFGSYDDKDKKWISVVGVVADIRNSGLQVAPHGQIYRSEAQRPTGDATFVVRTAGDPKAIAAGARAAIHQVDRDQPVSEVWTMQEVVARSLAQRRFNMVLLALFAGLALVLAAIGLYGLTAYSVSQRTREMGLRLALGARPLQVLGLVVREAAVLSVLGVGVGLAAAWAGGRVLASLLYGVSPTDFATFVAVPLALTSVALFAAYLPGRRATRVDPLSALRAG